MCYPCTIAYLKKTSTALTEAAFVVSFYYIGCNGTLNDKMVVVVELIFQTIICLLLLLLVLCWRGVSLSSLPVECKVKGKLLYCMESRLVVSVERFFAVQVPLCHCYYILELCVYCIFNYVYFIFGFHILYETVSH